MNQPIPTIHWQGDVGGSLFLLDQKRLPAEIELIECVDVDQVWIAIQELSVRGAPAIGIAAAYGVCLGAQVALDTELESMQSRVRQVCNYLAESRPTAVNLSWALERMRLVADNETKCGPRELAAKLLAEARAIHAEDDQMCDHIGQYGAELLDELPVGAGILTHCNTGALATGGQGTALSVIFELASRGKHPRVWVDETRPLLQGARLTTWELMQRAIECTLICDSAAAHVLATGQVQAVITGADRIAANGDTANKIGTYALAVLSRAHGVPFYVAAPTSTFDMTIASGNEIPIEQRSGQEVVNGFGMATAPAGVAVYNPAFDVTPAELISGIITERGVVEQPSRDKLESLVGRIE